MNPHTPKRTPISGVRVSMDFQIFRGQFQGSKLIGLKSYLYHWKSFEMKMSKMHLHDPFRYLEHKLWPKEGPRVKLPIWPPTTKSWELPWFLCMKVMCQILLESSQWRLKLCFRPHLSQRFS
jgi:hypothetical protein